MGESIDKILEVQMNEIKKSKEELIRECEMVILEGWVWLDAAREEMAKKAYRMSGTPRQELERFLAPLVKKLDEFDAQIERTMAAVDLLKKD
jgi:hypothetical protein